MAAGGSFYHATDGAAYAVFLGRWTCRLAEPLLCFADFPSAGDLLDVGCGTGSLASAMAARWPKRRVVGLDIAPPYVAFARSQAGSENSHFRSGYATNLPHAAVSFAGTAAQLVLNFVRDPVAALSEMRRVTVTGGRLVAAVWDFRGGLVYQRIFWDTAAPSTPVAALARDRLFAGALALPEGLVRLFEGAGLDRVGADFPTDRDQSPPRPGRCEATSDDSCARQPEDALPDAGGFSGVAISDTALICA